MAISIRPGRVIKHGLNSIVATLLLLGILFIINFLSARNNFRIDLTGHDKYTLSPQSISVLKNLNEPVLITALMQSSSMS